MEEFDSFTEKLDFQLINQIAKNRLNAISIKFDIFKKTFVQIFKNIVKNLYYMHVTARQGKLINDS